MVKEQSNLQILVKFTLGIFIWVNYKVKVNFYFPMEIFIKESLLIIKLTGLVNFLKLNPKMLNQAI